jgi:glycosyltransferase involved in cell wall biosynthesis
MLCKFSDWYVYWYQKSNHPEAVAIRNIISQNRQHSFILLGDGTKFEHFKADGVYFYNVGQRTVASYLFSFLLKFELANILRPSVIVCLGATNSIPLGISSILTRAKFILVITGEISYAVESMPKYLRKVVAFLLKIIFHKAHKILALGKSIRKNLIDNYGVNPEKIFLYKYKIPEIFSPNVASDLKASLNPNGPIVLTICRISPEKGLSYLIEASRIITEKFPNVRIIIKGSYGASRTTEKYYEQLTGLIRKRNLQEHITILDDSPYSEIPKYLSAADVFVLPSLSEGFPLVILEALATGVPVVATPVGGIPDILVNKTNSLLIKPRDVEGLAGAITRVLSEDELRKRMIENGLRSIRGIKENEIENLLSKFIFEGGH